MDENNVEFAKGDLLFQEGDTSKDLFIIQSGWVKICKASASGQEVVIALVKAGQFVGELSFFDGKPRSATAIALTKVKAVQLSANMLEKEIKKIPSWIILLVKSVSERLRDANDLFKKNNLVNEAIIQEIQKVEKDDSFI